jgi:hypothetical protein
VGGGHAVRAELRRGVRGARPDQQRFERPVLRDRARQRQRLQRQLVRAAVLVLDKD